VICKSASVPQIAVWAYWSDWMGTWKPPSRRSGCLHTDWQTHSPTAESCSLACVASRAGQMDRLHCFAIFAAVQYCTVFKILVTDGARKESRCSKFVHRNRIASMIELAICLSECVVFSFQCPIVAWFCSQWTIRALKMSMACVECHPWKSPSFWGQLIGWNYNGFFCF